MERNIFYIKKKLSTQQHSPWGDQNMRTLYEYMPRSARQASVAAFIFPLTLWSNINARERWPAININGQLHERWFHFRKASSSTVEATSCSAVVRLRSPFNKVLDVKATGFPFWLSTAAIAKFGALHSTGKGSFSPTLTPWVCTFTAATHRALSACTLITCSLFAFVCLLAEMTRRRFAGRRFATSLGHQRWRWRISF